jgi:hypothetical protein
MGIDILISLVAAVVSMAAGSVVAAAPIEKALRRFFRIPRRTPTETYAERLAKLTDTLKRSSEDVDGVIEELSTVARERENAVRKLEADLASLSEREQELQKRVDDLQNVPLPVAEHFAALTSVGEKRSARRDYVLFGLGVVVSTVISIIFFLIQG